MQTVTGTNRLLAAILVVAIVGMGWTAAVGYLTRTSAELRLSALEAKEHENEIVRSNYEHTAAVMRDKMRAMDAWLDEAMDILDPKKKPHHYGQ